MNVTRPHLARAGVTLLPVAALLLVGLLALPHLDPQSTRFFLLILAVSIGGVLVGELAMLFFLQRLRQRRYQALIEACQDALVGHTDIRPHMQGDPTLLPLARLLNMLLDTIALAHKHSQQQQAAVLRHQQEQAALRTQLQHTQTTQAHLSTQVQHLLRTLSPVLQGDLRVRAALPPGEVGMLADVCNALIEEAITLVGWTRSSSQQFTSQTRTLLTAAIALAQQVEDHLRHVSQTIETTEQMVACLHHSSATLQLSLDSMGSLQARFHPPLLPTPDHADLLEHLEHTTRYHLHLLTELGQTIPSHAALARTLIAQYTTFAQGLHQSSIGVLQVAEHLTTFAWLAEQRAEELRAFQLPEPEPHTPSQPPAAPPPPLAGVKRQGASPASLPERGLEQFQAHLV